jgi:C4-dicarboxylate transporter, DctM subunit
VIAGVSISDLFIAGLVPGIMIGLGLMLVVYRYAVKMGLPIEGRFQVSNLLKAFKRAFFGLLLAVVIIGGILWGFFTPTEAGAAGVLYALLLSMLVYREFTFKDLIWALSGTAKQTAIVILMVGTSAVLSWYLGQQMIPQGLAKFMMGLSNNVYVILLLVNILLFIGGMFLHGTPLIIMMVPILAPLVKGVGVDLVQFGIVCCISISIGQITPPVASVLMVTASIGNISIDKVVKPLLPMIFAMVVVLLLVSFWPDLSLWLPKMLMK